MSIWATAVSIDAADHANNCARWIPQARSDIPKDVELRWDDDGSCWRLDNTRPCTCYAGPLRYVDSSTVPTVDGDRAGWVSLCEIPADVVDPDADDELVLPWLRLWVSDGQVCGSKHAGSPVVLDRGQVQRIHDYLSRWLERAGGVA